MTFGISFGIGKRTFRFGALIGIGNQGAGAPLVDKITTIIRNVENGQEIARYKGRGILLSPWRRNKYREGLPQKILIIATQVA